MEPQFLALPRVWKPRGAPAGAPDLELVPKPPFGWAPPGTALGASVGALPNRAIEEVKDFSHRMTHQLIFEWWAFSTDNQQTNGQD